MPAIVDVQMVDAADISYRSPTRPHFGMSAQKHFCSAIDSGNRASASIPRGTPRSCVHCQLRALVISTSRVAPSRGRRTLEDAGYVGSATYLVGVLHIELLHGILAGHLSSLHISTTSPPKTVDHPPLYSHACLLYRRSPACMHGRTHAPVAPATALQPVVPNSKGKRRSAQRSRSALCRTATRV